MAGGAGHVARVMFAAGPVVVFASCVAGGAGLSDLTRRHLGEILDVAVAICVHMRLAGTVTGLAGVLGRWRTHVLGASVRRVVILPLILVALEALLFANIFASARGRLTARRGSGAFDSRRGSLGWCDRVVLSCRRMCTGDDDDAEPHEQRSGERGTWTGGSSHDSAQDDPELVEGALQGTHVSSLLRLRDRAQRRLADDFDALPRRRPDDSKRCACG